MSTTSSNPFQYSQLPRGRIFLAGWVFFCIQAILTMISLQLSLGLHFPNSMFVVVPFILLMNLFGRHNRIGWARPLTAVALLIESLSAFGHGWLLLHGAADVPAAQAHIVPKMAALGLTLDLMVMLLLVSGWRAARAIDDGAGKV
jgi:hypothetical protein